MPAKGEEPDRRAHMQATFWMAIIARDALIDGDLAAARSVAHELAVHDYETAFPESWKHWVSEMQKHALELATAADEKEAGQAIGALAVSCGNCHYDQKGGFKLGATEPMPWTDPPETIDARMERHAVGIEQMWFGLIAPSDEAWRAGTITLTRAPLEPPQDDEGPVDRSVDTQFERLRYFAKQARIAPTYAERARLYGEAITTCAHCHGATSYIDR